LIIHGDVINKDVEEIIKKNGIKTIIIGHEHPAVSIHDGPEPKHSNVFLRANGKRKH